MIPCQAVAAPAAARRSTLLAEALASRLAEQALCRRQRTGASADPTVAAASIPRTAGRATRAAGSHDRTAGEWPLTQYRRRPRRPDDRPRCHRC